MENGKEVTIDGTVYVPKVRSKNGMQYVMVRTYSAGVHCGYLESMQGKEVVLVDSIRIWKWSGAASLSQLAMEGTNDPDECKFAMPITTQLILTEAIEVITMTEIAIINIKSVPPWEA